jgi:hypothetical protein
MLVEVSSLSKTEKALWGTVKGLLFRGLSVEYITVMIINIRNK